MSSSCNGISLGKYWVVFSATFEFHPIKYQPSSYSPPPPTLMGSYGKKDGILKIFKINFQ